MPLYDWQTECLERWAENKYKGIVNVVTGAGKTIFALAAITLLEDTLNDPSLRVKIIVPKSFLVRQWFYALKDKLGVSREEIGIFSGTLKSKTDSKYMIYVINSARYSFARHIAYDSKSPLLIIADECHHYGSEENSKIFDFTKVIPKNYHYYALGLSATPYCKYYNEVLTKYLGKEIYRYGFVQALEADIISGFSLVNIGLEFNRHERAEYIDLSDKLTIALQRLRKHCPYLQFSNRGRFFADIDKISKSSKNQDARELAQAVAILSFRRKEIVHSASARIKCVLDLINLIDKNSKIIVFGERIEMANEIYERLNKIFPNNAGIYHSKIHKDVGKIALRKFEDSEIRILVSCRTLDEGLNISDTDVGIVVSSTSSERQRIQRLGRVLRKKETGEQAYFYHLFVKGTMEEDDVLGEQSDRLSEIVDIVDFDYDEDNESFINSYYELLTEKAVNYAKNKLWDTEKIAELLKNIRLGAVRCDWLADEQWCIDKIKNAETKSKRNYFIAMLFLIRVGAE